MREYTKSSMEPVSQGFGTGSPEGVGVEPVVVRPRPAARRVVGTGARGAERVGVRRASRPRPVRPESVAVTVRPPQVERPQLVEASRCVAPARQRVLVRPAAPSAAVIRVRRVLAGAAVTVLAAALVAGLGLLAEATAQMRSGPAESAPAAISVVGPVDVPFTVRVESPGTVWDVARRVAPAAQGPELAEVVDHIVSANSLESVVVHSGQVLVVPR